ncbi:DUF4352 domain-containing protein [Sphingopyxis sp.]|jgi:hypothetical protein|uniref:DUF4352 domain-containing protein n=1 Tax=Sphingopyxis sp. TaxID=1908224 RepID=UPI002E07CC0C|nr:DUF4352 domain-containing protein [Sphingopyxis sp.]
MIAQLNRAALAFLLTLGLAACGGGDDTASNAVAETPTERDLPTVAIGKSAKGNDLEITIKSVETQSKVGVYGMGPTLSPDETFVVVRYTIKNVGSAPVDRGNQPDIKLIDGNSQEYAEDGEAEMLEAIKNNDDTGTLNPNVTYKKTAVWRLGKASFDKATWRVKVPLDTTTDATIEKIARWPLDSKAPAPLMFALK